MVTARHGASTLDRPEDSVADRDATTDPVPLLDPKSWRDRLVPPMPAGGWRGWLGPVIVTIIAAVLRLTDLGRPRALIFDETYYAKDGLSLLRFGTEQQFKPDANDLIIASNGEPSTLDVFSGGAAYVVHPPLGKWVIAAGESVFGVTPFGWRLPMAIIGILSVLMLARIVRRLLRSNLWGTVAGGLLAVDGLGIVMSRTAVLDNVLMGTTLAAFGCLLLDRDQTRRRVAERLPAGADPWTLWESSFGPRLGPILGMRPWRLTAAVFLGLGCGVKWSGIWFVVGFGLLTVLWDVGLRRTIGVHRPWAGALIRDALPAAAWMVTIVLVVYLGTWAGWFLTDSGYNRQWAASRTTSFGFIPDALRSLWHYHAEALNFHTHLVSPHSYQANAWAWPLQTRPTSFHYLEAKSYENGVTCGADRCAQEVLALGNPLIWWAGAIAMLHQAWRWVGRRDWRSGAVLAGFVAGWAPWLMFQERTVFEFYSIVFLPFVVMALAMSLSTVRGAATASKARLRTGTVLVTLFLVAVVAVSWFFFPIWTGIPLPYDSWHLRMWFPTWV